MIIRAVRLTNRIGWAFNIYGFKFPIILGYREAYYDPPLVGQGYDMRLALEQGSTLKYRNHWLQRPPAHLNSCELSTICEVPRKYIRSYKFWREWYSIWKSIEYTFSRH